MSVAVAPRIEIIPATIGMTKNGQAIKPKILRVAAYCRVSTDDEDQLHSYNAQKEYFEKKIKETPNWEFVGVYADEGISGTSLKKRDDFNRMIADAYAGKIDIILIKSLSRYMRNQLISVDYARKMREIGVSIYFEKEDLDTLPVSSEFRLGIFSAFAQGESESISENVKWGKRKKFKDGKVPFTRMLGYIKSATGGYEVEPNEAKIVVRIYKRFLDGESAATIKKDLEKDGIHTLSGKTQWTTGGILAILKNEKYMGDAILQKTYIKDFLSKEVVKNVNDLPKWHIYNNHEGIVSRDMFNKVQEELARRNNRKKVLRKRAKTENGKYSSKYALTEKMVCGECESAYKRVTWARNGTKKSLWRCTNRLEYGTKYCKASPTINEGLLQDAILQAINELVINKKEITQNLQNALIIAIEGTPTGRDISEIEAEINSKIENLTKIVQHNAKHNLPIDYSDGEIKILNDQIRILMAEKEENARNSANRTQNNTQIKEMINILEKEKFSLTEYNETIVRKMIHEVKVIDELSIQVDFKNGYRVVKKI